MKKFAIILAGGEGRRAGGNLPKQFVDLKGKPLVWWSMNAFHAADPTTTIILVVHPGFLFDWDMMCSEMRAEERIEHVVCCGGRSRPESVRNGLLSVSEILDALEGEDRDGAIVAVHDGARPLVSPDMINRGIAAAGDGVGVVPAVRCVNSLRRLLDKESPFGKTGDSVVADRSEFVEVQTPQIFRYLDLHKAYFREEDISVFTDDASLAETAGVRIALYEGEPENIKVTHPADFRIAEAILG